MEFEVKEIKRIKRTYKGKQGNECEEHRLLISCENEAGEKLKLDLRDADGAPEIGDTISADTDKRQTKLDG
jgi:hypothetical protein